MGNDLLIRIVLAVVRGGMPIVGVMRYGWTVEYVAFFFWLELVMFCLFMAIVTLRDTWTGSLTLRFGVTAPLVVLGMQIPALVIGVFMTIGIKGPLDKLAYLARLLEDPTLRTAALIQVAITVVTAFRWNFRRTDSNAVLDRQGRELMKRVVTTLIIGGAAVAVVAIWNTASDAAEYVANRRHALAAAWIVGITWAVSDLFPRMITRFLAIFGERECDETAAKRR